MSSTISIRDGLSIEDRAREAKPTIDPGFVNRRLVQTVLGENGMKIIDQINSRLPPHPDYQHEVRLDHIYKDVVLKFCEVQGIRSLEQVLSYGNGNLFSSVETLGPCKDVYDKERVVSHWIARGETKWAVEFHYSTQWIHSDTTRMQLRDGDNIAIVAQVYCKKGNTLICHPLIMGGPWLQAKDPAWDAEAMWWGQDFFEHFVEDIDEFELVRNLPTPKSHEPMKNISERAFKVCLSSILGEEATKDWGGETSDLFASHLHLSGRRVTGAFLLKGPARYRPMGLNQLGKNNDQIVRLAEEPADLLVVQHCHDILPAVRKTLRAFAVQPSQARRYCLIDGKDSLRLLQAYEMVDRAIEISRGLDA